MIRRGRVLAVAIALATATLSTVTLPTAGDAAAAAPRPATTAATTTAGSHQVTLITGDRVRATRGHDGTWSFGFDAGQRGAAPAGYQQYPSPRGDWYVVPHEAAPLVAAGKLDRELFNVTALISQRYDDARSDSLPLLLEYPDATVAQRSPAPQGAQVERQLAGRNLAVVTERKADARTFWRGLTAGATNGATTALSGGPSKVWLNARFTASLDVSVPQIGAPAAWQRGHTGQGVTVAVLDTGADDGHPDLAGRIVRSQDFTGTGSTRDGHGHGTHVAATIAGSGAASDGRYSGVAPGARLAVGKVLDDSGFDQLDDILAGMEWAARDAGAKVVNMSLGGGPTDGTDPASRAINDLTRQYGTLFVVAAGNYGADEAVTTPATADAALAVGSVTKSDELSEFSSRGPRYVDGAVKPEIAAPGSDIVAAKAAGTQLGEPVGEHHVRLSGTSMASPHTAGAAAILAAQHPDWAADRLKAALVGTATPVEGAGVFAVGAGRVDLDRATGQAVQAAPATVNGYLAWPDRKRQRHTVSYRNSGSTPVTLALQLQLADAGGTAPPAGLARLSTSSVTVPAGGTASATLTLNPRSGRPGVYGGVLSAATADGSVRLRTPVAVHDEPEKYDLTVNLLDRNGAAPGPNTSAAVGLLNLDNGDWYPFVPSGERLRLVSGRYSIVGHVATPRAGEVPSISTLAHPELRLSRNTTLTLDARQARRVTVGTDQPAARGGVWTARFQIRSDGSPYPNAWLYGFDPRFHEVYAYSTPGVSSPAFGYANNLRLEEPDIELFAEQPERFEVPAFWFYTSPRPDGTQRRAVVNGGAGRPEDLAGLDVRDKLVVLDLPATTTFEEAFERIRNVAGAGGAMVALNITSTSALAASRALAAPAEDNPVVLPTVEMLDAPGQRFSDLAKAGGLRSSFTARSSSAYRYELSFPSPGHVPQELTYQVRTADLAAVRMAYHGFSPDAPPSAGAWVEALGGEISTQWSVPVPLQAERVEHFTPGTWRLPLSQVFVVDNRGYFSDLSETIALDGGREYRIRWNSAVIGPGFAGTTSDELGSDHPWACRVGNMLDVNVPFFSDGTGHARPAIHEYAVDSGSTRLERDGSLVGTTNLPGRGVFFAAQGDEAEYRLTADVVRDHPAWPTSTRVSGSWTFRTQFRQGPSCEALPLLAVRFAPEVDLRNNAPGGGPFSFPVSVPRQDGPASISSLELEISYDDGASWQPVTVAPDGPAWRATVDHPASGFASLRARAADTEGNTVEQTIIRAYQFGG